MKRLCWLFHGYGGVQTSCHVDAGEEKRITYKLFCELAGIYFIRTLPDLKNNSVLTIRWNKLQYTDDELISKNMILLYKR